MALTTRQLDDYRRILTVSREELALATVRAEAAVTEQVDLDRLDYGDRANGAVAKEDLLREAGRDSEQLSQVEAALRRIDRGLYGICAECGDQIPTARLDAVPWATLCVRDQENADRRRRATGTISGGALSRVVA